VNERRREMAIQFWKYHIRKMSILVIGKKEGKRWCLVDTRKVFLEMESSNDGV
jgi:hypothetical protein